MTKDKTTMYPAVQKLCEMLFPRRRRCGLSGINLSQTSFAQQSIVGGSYKVWIWEEPSEMPRETCVEEGRKVQQQQKLVDYSLHVRAEYWDRLNVLLSPALPCPSTVPFSQISMPEHTKSYRHKNWRRSVVVMELFWFLLYTQYRLSETPWKAA